MRTSAKLITALSVAGLAVAAGSAFTGAGAKSTAGVGFVGGSVSQTIEGATLTSTSYTYTTAGAVQSVDLTFAADADNKSVAATLTDGVTPAALTCDAEPTIADPTINCSIVTAYPNATGLTITVSN